MEKTAIVAEVKRNAKKINPNDLAIKVNAIKNNLANYTLTLEIFSLETM